MIPLLLDGLLRESMHATPIECTGVRAIRRSSMTKRKKAAAGRARGHRAGARASTRRENSKQTRVIALMRRPQGATVDEMQRATGWQPHTVRGAIAGVIKKRLGLAVASTKEERGRVYRIATRA
jgi:Protein of unknown function (DUF3489)